MQTMNTAASFVNGFNYIIRSIVHQINRIADADAVVT